MFLLISGFTLINTNSFPLFQMEGVYISDISLKAIKNITDNFKVKVIENDRKFNLDMDIYSPCALGGILNDQTINRLKCNLIVGGANNQLEDEIEHDKMLYNKNIMYIPDFLVNAGGVINCYFEFNDKYSRNKVIEKVENIYSTSSKVLKLSKEKDLPTQYIAIELAKERIHNKKHSKLNLD